MASPEDATGRLYGSFCPEGSIIPCMTNRGQTGDTAEVIAIDEHAALCLAAYDAGSPIWQALVDGTSFDKLVTALISLYESMPERLEPDIDRLFLAFEERGLLVHS